MSYLPIGAYGLVGDSRAAALVATNGSIDWLCLPRFDSPSVFGRLLDHESGGYFAIGPAAGGVGRQSYIEDTNVLQTTFETETGELVVTDFMPALTEALKRTRLMPQRQLVRLVEARGQVDVAVRFEPRPNYGRRVPRMHQHTPTAIVAETGRDWLHLRSDFPLELSDGAAVSHFSLADGEQRSLLLSYALHETGVLPAQDDGRWLLDRTVEFWREWTTCCSYVGPFQKQVRRSALALKLLAYAPTGGIIAAPTTSLPERIGGERNWDYRYCWLRDASLTVRALLDVDCAEEAQSFTEWLLHATRLTHPRLQVMYDVYGETRLREREMTHMEGYRGSRPVRVGNAAAEQHQLDIYGEVFDAVATYLARTGVRPDGETRGMLRRMADHVVNIWEQPDEGIWEVRSVRLHHTYSKAMAAVALDRAVSLRNAGLIDGDARRWEEAAAAIRRKVMTQGFNRRLGAFTRTFDGEDVDASLLLLPLLGFLPADAPEMVSTVDRIVADLGENDYIYRYRQVDDGISGGEGAFLACGFWLATVMAQRGELAESQRLIEQQCRAANSLALLPEEVDPLTHEELGNFPQGLSHIALLNAAVALSEASNGPR